MLFVALHCGVEYGVHDYGVVASHCGDFKFCRVHNCGGLWGDWLLPCPVYCGVGVYVAWSICGVYGDLVCCGSIVAHKSVAWRVCCVCSMPRRSHFGARRARPASYLSPWLGRLPYLRCTVWQSPIYVIAACSTGVRACRACPSSPHRPFRFITMWGPPSVCPVVFIFPPQLESAFSKGCLLIVFVIGVASSKQAKASPNVCVRSLR